MLFLAFIFRAVIFSSVFVCFFPLSFLLPFLFGWGRWTDQLVVEGLLLVKTRYNRGIVVFGSTGDRGNVWNLEICLHAPYHGSGGQTMDSTTRRINHCPVDQP